MTLESEQEKRFAERPADTAKQKRNLAGHGAGADRPVTAALLTPLRSVRARGGEGSSRASAHLVGALVGAFVGALRARQAHDAGVTESEQEKR